MTKKNDPDEGSIRIETAILCDEIRTENNGKMIFIGVYSDTIQVPTVPAHMRGLSFALRGIGIRKGKVRFGLTVADPQHNNVIQSGGELNFQGSDGATFWIAINGPAVFLPTEGGYAITVEINESVDVRQTFYVRKMPLPTVSQPAEIAQNPN